MSKELDYLKSVSSFFRRTTAKIKLITLIEKAKQEYDKYDFKAGKHSLLAAYNLDKKNPTVLRGLGCIAIAEGDYTEAVKYFEKALQFSTSKEIEYTLIGTAYYYLENLDEAIKYYNLAIDQNDDYDSAYEGRNQAMLENHLKIIDFQEALKKYF